MPDHTLPASLSMFARLRASRAPALHTSSTPYLHVSTALHLQRASRAPELENSIPQYHHIETPTSRLRHSIPPCLRVCAPATHLHRSVPPYLHITTPAVYHQGPRAPCRRTSTRPRRYPTRDSRAQYLDTSTSTPSARIQRASSCSKAHTYMPPRRRVCSAPPALHTSKSLQLQRASRTAELYTDMRRRRSRGSELNDSMPPRHQTYNAPLGAPYLHASTSTRLQHDPRAPYLRISASARLQLASGAPELNTSTSPHRYRANRAAYYHRDICIAPPGL